MSGHDGDANDADCWNRAKKRRWENETGLPNDDINELEKFARQGKKQYNHCLQNDDDVVDEESIRFNKTKNVHELPARGLSLTRSPSHLSHFGLQSNPDAGVVCNQATLNGESMTTSVQQQAELESLPRWPATAQPPLELNRLTEESISPPSSLPSHAASETDFVASTASAFSARLDSQLLEQLRTALAKRDGLIRQAQQSFDITVALTYLLQSNNATTEASLASLQIANQRFQTLAFELMHCPVQYTFDFHNAISSSQGRKQESSVLLENSLHQGLQRSIPNFASQAINLLAEREPSTSQEVTAETGLILACAEDRGMLNDHQRYLRQQLEFFRATRSDVMSRTRGRSKTIALRQVGIRCRHCSHIPVGNRSKGSTYYSTTLMGIYQAAQNISVEHLQSGLCSETPDEVKTTLLRTRAAKTASSGAGKAYWADSAQKLGLKDTENGIRFATDGASSKMQPFASLMSPPL